MPWRPLSIFVSFPVRSRRRAGADRSNAGGGAKGGSSNRAQLPPDAPSGGAKGRPRNRADLPPDLPASGAKGRSSNRADLPPDLPGGGRSGNRADLPPDLPSSGAKGRSSSRADLPPDPLSGGAKGRSSSRADVRPRAPKGGAKGQSCSTADLRLDVPSDGGAKGQSSRADVRPDVPAALPSGRPSHSDAAEIDGEIARLHAENDRLRQLLEQDGGAPWTFALLAELERESHEQRRIRCLQRELCMALQRRCRLEQTVRAGHASLERALYGALSQNNASLQSLEQAFADGAAAAEAELAEEAILVDSDAAPKQPGRRSSPSPSPAGTPSTGSGTAAAAKATSSRRRWEAAQIYELEQDVFKAASSLSGLADASGEVWPGQLASRFEAASWQLLRARELSTTDADADASAAAVRRRLWRAMAGRAATVPRDLQSESSASSAAEPLLDYTYIDPSARVLKPHLLRTCA